MRPLQIYKQAFSGLSASNWYLSLVTLINRSGTMVVPFMTIYCTQRLNFTITQAGIIMGLFGVGAMVGSFVGGKITDRYGFYYLQIGALVSGGILFMLLGFQINFFALCACTFILSACNESFRPANAAAIICYSSPENRTRSYSLNRFAINLGWSFGGALGGYLASINYHLLFWVDGCTNIFAAMLLFKLLPPVKPATLAEKPTSAQSSSAYRDPLYLAFIVLVILYAMSFFQIFTMQPVFFKTEWHFDERFIGAMMALNGIVIIAFEMVIIHKLEGKRHPLFFIILGTLITGTGFVLTNLLPPGVTAAVIIVLLIAFGEILALPFMNTFWISRTNSFNQGEYGALYSMAWATAQILSPSIGSFIIMSKGYNMLWWILAICCVAAAFGFSTIHRKLKQLHVFATN